MPEGWRSIKLGEVLDELDERCGERDLPVLSITKNQGIMLASERFDRALHGRNLPKYRVAPRGSIALDPMLLWSGTIGRQKVVDAGIVSPDYRVYEARADALPEYLEYAFKGHRMAAQFKASARGTNVRRNRIARSDFLALKLDLPPLAEQRKVAAILSSVDEAIEKTQAVIDQAQAVKKGLIQVLLTKGLPGRHTSFKQTEIGRIPEGWSVRRLAECLSEPIRNGHSPVCPTEPTGAWILHLGAVTPDGYDRSAVKPAPRDDPKVEAAILRAGDLLVSRSNTRARVGLAGIYDGSPGPCSYPDLLMRVRTQQSVLSAEFLQTWILGPFGREYMEANARGTNASMVKINRTILDGMPIPLPPIDEQASIVSNLATVEGYRTAHREKLAALVTLKSALQSLLLTGELRVRPDPTPEPA